MTVREFCLIKTQTGELCVFRDRGWVISAVYIDSEDLFVIDYGILAREVKADEWGTLPIVTKHGDPLMIPCHYIDV